MLNVFWLTNMKIIKLKISKGSTELFKLNSFDYNGFSTLEWEWRICPLCFETQTNWSENERYARSNLRFPLRHNLGDFIAGLPNETTSWGFWFHSAFSSLYPLSPLLSGLPAPCSALYLIPLCACLRQSQAQNSFKFNSNVTFCIIFSVFFSFCVGIFGPFEKCRKVERGRTESGTAGRRGLKNTVTERLNRFGFEGRCEFFLPLQSSFVCLFCFPARQLFTLLLLFLCVLAAAVSVLCQLPLLSKNGCIICTHIFSYFLCFLFVLRQPELRRLETWFMRVFSLLFLFFCCCCCCSYCHLYWWGVFYFMSLGVCVTPVPIRLRRSSSVGTPRTCWLWVLSDCWQFS